MHVIALPCVALKTAFARRRSIAARIQRLCFEGGLGGVAGERCAEVTGLSPLPQVYPVPIVLAPDLAPDKSRCRDKAYVARNLGDVLASVGSANLNAWSAGADEGLTVEQHAARADAALQRPENQSLPGSVAHPRQTRLKNWHLRRRFLEAFKVRQGVPPLAVRAALAVWFSCSRLLVIMLATRQAQDRCCMPCPAAPAARPQVCQA